MLKYAFTDLTDHEVNLIGSSLSDRPFKEVAGLLQKVQQQIQAQEAAAAKAAQEAAAAPKAAASEETPEA